MADDDLTPEEKAEAKRIAAEKRQTDTESAFFAMMDKWVAKRAADAPPPKTPGVARPPSFLEALFGSLPAPDPDKSKTA